MNNLDDYREVNTLKGCKSNEIVKITNYKLIKTMPYNRGQIVGFDEKRVKGLIQIYESGRYYDEMSVIIVNKSGYPLNGNNRVEMAKRLGIPLLVRVLTAPIYNENLEKLIEIITVYNSKNPAWSAREQFRTALLMENKLALQLDTLWSRIIANNPRLSVNSITKNQMIVMLKRNPAMTKATKVDYADFNNSDLWEYAKSEEFEEELKYISNIVSYFKDSPIQANGVLIQLFKFMWSNYPKFNKERFWKNLLDYGFVLDNTLTNNKGKKVQMSKKINQRIIELINM